MQGSFLNRRVDQPIRFRTSMMALDGKLESVRLLIPDAGDWQLSLVVWIDYDTFKRIDRSNYFGYTIESIDADSFEMTSDRLVQMELRAEGAARASVADRAGEALLDRVVEVLASGDPDAPLLDAANYLYLSVYQEREMDGVTMLKGFTSIYRRET